MPHILEFGASLLIYFSYVLGSLGVASAVMLLLDRIFADHQDKATVG